MNFGRQVSVTFIYIQKERYKNDRDSVMIAQLETECISLSVLSDGLVQFTTVAEYLKGLSLDDHMCCLIHS